MRIRGIFTTLLAVTILTSPIVSIHSQKVEAVETKDSWTEYFRMGTSANRTHPYADAQAFIDISKAERKSIMQHFSSLFQDQLIPAWYNAKIEKVSALNNGTYTQEIFIPLTYTPKGIADGYLKEEPKERLFYALINEPGEGMPNAIANDHYASATHAFDDGVETNGWRLLVRDISYTSQEKKNSRGLPSTKPIGITITRTVKNGTDPLKPVPNHPVDIDYAGSKPITVYRYKAVKKGKKKLVKAGRIKAYQAFYVYGRTKNNLLKVGSNRYIYNSAIYKTESSVY